MGAGNRDSGDPTAHEILLLEEHGGMERTVWSSGASDAVQRRLEENRQVADAESVSVDVAAERLGVSVSQIVQWVEGRKLSAWRRGEELRLPLWQFSGDGLLPHLAELLAALPANLHPMAATGFVTSPTDELDGMTVIDWLTAGGDLAPVAFAASSLDRWYAPPGTR
jgi:excisionase family DNA binding protein